MQNIKKISQKLKILNKKLYIVWGFCREKILNWNNKWGDIDLVTDATPDEMMKVLKIVGEIGKKYGTCIVSEWNEAFEITTLRKDIWTINNRKPARVVFTNSLEEDSKRRDFTCNAIYFDVENENFIDPVWGIEDIKNNVIRFVWNAEKRINEDALRILRFIRFKNKYWFELKNNNYFEILKQKTDLLKNISVERIRQELDKIILLKNNVQALEDLKNINFFKHIIPEIDNLEKVPWNKYHLEGNVWIHTKMCVEQLNKYYKNVSTNDFNLLQNNKLILYYTILFHDIAKYNTLSFDTNKQAHYYNHENIWAEIFKNKIACRLKFTNTQKKEITWLIKNHIKLFMLVEMRKLKARKFMMNSLFEKLLIIWEIDNSGRIPVKYKEIKEIKNIYLKFKKVLKNIVFLTWKDIMQKYPELEWKKIGERLESLNNEILVKN